MAFHQNAVTILRSLDALRRRRPCRAPLARPLYFRCHSRRVSFLLFQSGSFGIWPGNSPDSSPYEWTFGTFRHKPLGKIVYTFSGSDPARRQTMKRPWARSPPRKSLLSALCHPKDVASPQW